MPRYFRRRRARAHLASALPAWTLNSWLWTPNCRPSTVDCGL